MTAIRLDTHSSGRRRAIDQLEHHRTARRA
jgi:hypothetical protein